MGIQSNQRVNVTGTNVDAYINISNIQVSKQTRKVVLVEGVKAVEGREATERREAVEAVEGVKRVTEMQSFTMCNYTISMYAARGMKSSFSRKHFEFNFDLESGLNIYEQCYADLKTRSNFTDAVDVQP